jgi:hypothetical protein
VRGSLFLGLLCVLLGASALSCSSEESKGDNGGAAGKGGSSWRRRNLRPDDARLSHRVPCHRSARVLQYDQPVMMVRENDALVLPDWSHHGRRHRRHRRHRQRSRRSRLCGRGVGRGGLSAGRPRPRTSSRSKTSSATRGARHRGGALRRRGHGRQDALHTDFTKGTVTTPPTARSTRASSGSCIPRARWSRIA